MTRSAPYAISLDVGGTSIKSGVVFTDTADVGQHTQTPIESGESAQSILSTMTSVIRHHAGATKGGSLAGIVLAFPGPFDYDAGISHISGVEKYESLLGVNVGSELRERLDVGDCPILFRNDAEAAIVGECLYGAGREHSRVIGLTLGTGFGSAFMLHGVPQTSGEGIPPNGWLYPFPVGDVRADDFFSIRGLETQLHEAGGLPTNPKAADELARQGDASSRAVFCAFGENLGAFLRPFTADFRAEVIVVLGGIAEAFDLFGPALGASVRIPVAPGRRGADAAMLGAAELLSERSIE